MPSSPASHQSPLVSVLMPVYDSARFLREAMESVAAQTYGAVEIVVVDGPSSDGTATLAQSFSRVRYLRQTGTGMWNALNEGLAAARGALIAFLSDDDVWEPDKLRLQVELLRQHPEVGYVGGATRFVRLGDEPLPPAFRTALLEGEHEAFMPEAILVRRAVFEQIGGFDESLEIASDIDWLVRAQEGGVLRLAVPQLVLRKRHHADNLSTRTAVGATMNRELLRIAREQIRRRGRA